jgi:hypothetical protein
MQGRPLDRGGPGAALPGLQTVCLSGRGKQKLDVGSPGQLANRAAQATYVGVQPSRLIQINTSGVSGGLAIPKPGFEPRAFSRGGVTIPPQFVLQKTTLSMPELN